MTKNDKKPYYVEFKDSTNNLKKLMAIFYNKDKTKIKTIHFGQKGALDYTTHNPNERDERKRLYDIRHKDRENWNDPMTAGSLSKFILWDKPSIEASKKSYMSKFNLKTL
jgi:superfamily I DNA and/or RNA helicase